MDVVNAHRNDPKLPWHIANTVMGDRLIGKELLLGTSWQGTFAMNDDEQRERFDRYVEDRPSPEKVAADKAVMAERRRASGLEGI